MMILGIDTSSKSGSAALVEGEEIREEIIAGPGISFSRGLLAMVDGLLARHGIPPRSLSAVAVARGPGSFTGIRIALATAQGISLASGVPLAGVDTLEAIVRAWGRDGMAAPVIDAGNGNAYHARFNVHNGHAERLSGDALSAAASLPGDIPRVGAAWPAEHIITRSVAAGAALCASRRFAGGLTPGWASAVPNYVQPGPAEKNVDHNQGGMNNVKLT